MDSARRRTWASAYTVACAGADAFPRIARDEKRSSFMLHAYVYEYVRAAATAAAAPHICNHIIGAQTLAWYGAHVEIYAPARHMCIYKHSGVCVVDGAQTALLLRRYVWIIIFIFVCI